MATVTELSTEYLTPEQVCDLVPGMTKTNLAQLRFKGIGPKYYKPTPRVILYSRDHIIEWVERSVRQGAAESA